MRHTLTIGLLATLSVLPAIAEAAPRRYRVDRDEGYERYDYPRHQGLLLRGTLGLGGSSADDDINDVTLSGGAAMLSLDIGGSIARNLALHGRLSANSMFEPSLSSGGEELGDLEDTSLTYSLLGLGLTYYFPSNLYLTGVVGLSRASFEFYGDEYDSLDGIGLMGDLGYEWAVARDLGIGIAGRLELHRVAGEGETLSAAALGVLLSATYF
jgi:hypothetical protein